MTKNKAVDAALLIIDQIFASQVIPEGHKVKYVEFIRDNGLTDKMIDELTKLFTEEAQNLEKSIANREKLLEGLDEAIKEERQKVDQTQAEMLYAYHKRAEEDVARVKKGVEKLESELEHIAEEVLEEAETSEEEAIRAKLGLKKENESK